MKPLNFYSVCVSWPKRDVDEGLIPMIDNAIDITRRTFLKHVNREEMKEIEQQLGYASHKSKGLTMADDWHISYHRSKLHGKTVYFFTWSGIEHVFTSR
jgi:hypothetical protein